MTSGSNVEEIHIRHSRHGWNIEWYRVKTPETIIGSSVFSYSNNKKPRVTKGSENQTKRSVASLLYRACNGCLAYCFRLFSLFKWAAWDQGNHQVLTPMIKRFSFYYLWSIPDSRAILHILKVSFQKRSSYFLTQRTATPRRPNSRMNSFYHTFKIIVSLNMNWIKEVICYLLNG
jgi:hypothetical protein